MKQESARYQQQTTFYLSFNKCYFCCEQTSLITGTLAQSPHLVNCTMHPSSKTCTSTFLSHFEHVEEIVSPHFLQL